MQIFDYDIWQEIFNTIRKHKLRTFLTALGVFWGIFMLVFLMGSGKGLENGVTGMFGNRAVNSLYVWTQRTTKPYNGLPPGRRARLTNDDIRAINSELGTKIQYMAPRIWIPSGEIVRNENKGSFDVRGESPDLLHIEPLEVAKGRFINVPDMEQKRKVIIIGQRVKDVLFQGEDEVIGEYLKISGADYQVVGIFKSKRGGGDGGDDESTIFMPLTTAQQVLNRPNEIGWFVCAMYDQVPVSSVEDDLKSILRERHQIAPDDEQGVRSFNLEEEFNQFQGLFAGIRWLVWFVGIGSLFAGVIGVGNIMLIVVKERTKEIGLRKALGATPRAIIQMVLLESVFITTVAGYLGLIFSTVIIFLMNLAVGDGGEFFAKPEVDFTVGIGAILVLVVSGALTGLVPALQAASIQPVVALRDE
ncbi:MAG: ABC transporter permease [Saprospiraceae bacterium]